MITSPKDRDKVTDTFEVQYNLTKGSQATHAHAYVDGLSIKRVLPGR